MKNVNSGPSEWESSSLPVCLQNAWKSFTEPGSVAITLSTWPALGSPRAPLILDVRREKAFDEDPRMIAAALRPDSDLAAFAARHAAGRPIVVYCVRGHEVSQEAARTLSHAGQDARFLEGGIEAWGAASLPTFQ